MSAAGDFLAANGEDQRAIELQSRNSCAAGWSEWDYLFAIPAKMLGPSFRPRIEQRNFCPGFRISGCLLGGLAQRTGNAGQRQILDNGLTTDCAGQHVVNMKRCFPSNLRQSAILTSVARAADNSGA